jgi:hypothetical protein
MAARHLVSSATREAFGLSEPTAITNVDPITTIFVRESLAEQARGVEMGLATIRSLAGDGCEWGHALLEKLHPE